MLEKLAKLLRKAETTDNEAEREAFMAKAQDLATRHQLDLEVARTHTASTERREEPEVRRIVLSRPRTMGAATYVELFDAIGRPNNVQLTISADSTTVWAYGFPSDIDLTEALYTSLVMQMRTAADAYLASGAHRQEKVWKESTQRWNWNTGEYTGRPEGMYPVSGRTARISFQNSFARQVGRRLTKAKAATMAALAEEETASPSTSAELVLKGREVQAAEFFAQETASVKRTWKGGRSSSHSSHASTAGREAGSRARLGSEKAIGGSRVEVSA